MPAALILASTSRYRRELLLRLRLPFEVVAPAVDETPLAGEAPADLAKRLALAKAREVARRHPAAVVIGSDQVADLDGEPIGKPGTHERAVAQLSRMSGRMVVFQTAVAVVHADQGFEKVALAPVRVRFRSLSAAEIERCFERPFPLAGCVHDAADRVEVRVFGKSVGGEFHQPGAHHRTVVPQRCNFLKWNNQLMSLRLFLYLRDYTLYLVQLHFLRLFITFLFSGFECTHC